MQDSYFAELHAQLAHLASPLDERSQTPSSMWQEPHQAQHEGYWQPHEESYAPPQPPLHSSPNNSGLLIDHNAMLQDLLDSLTQGKETQQVQQETCWQPYEEYYPQPQPQAYWQPYEESYARPYEDFYAPPQPPPQSSHEHSGKSNYYEEVIQQLNSLEQGREAQPFQQDAFWQPIEDFHRAKELAKWNNQFGQNEQRNEQIQEQIDDEPQASKQSLEMDEQLLLEEEEDEQHTARVEQTLPQPPKPSKPPTTSKDVPISINSNIIPPNVPFPGRFLIPKEEESEKDIVQVLPKVQVAGEHVECIKEDVVEITNAKEVEFVDTGQVTTIIVNLATCKVPANLNEVVFVIEFVSEHKGKTSSPISITFYTYMLLMIQAPTLEVKPWPDHFKYHRPFKDKPMHSNQKGDLGIAPIPDLRS